MIIGSLLLPSIGGGVCQTATTLFNNAFELGLPIVERHNHSFYISHYPMGRDATVSWGGPDFVFKNDLKTRDPDQDALHDSTLTFSFYGTDPSRRVVASTGERRRTGARPRRPTRSTPTRRAARSGRSPARTSPASTSPSRARSTSAGSCARRTRSRAPTSRSARRRSTAPAARSPARTSCCPPRGLVRACYCASAFSGSAGSSPSCARRSSRRRSAPPRRVVGDVQELDVLGRDHPVREQLSRRPSRAAPASSPVEEDDGEVQHLAGLDQRQRLEQPRRACRSRRGR